VVNSHAAWGAGLSHGAHTHEMHSSHRQRAHHPLSLYKTIS
jgi:hypothetical protein